MSLGSHPGAILFAKRERGRYPRAPLWERTSAEGVVFDSKAELRRWEVLRLLERAGEISDLRRQVEFTLAIEWRPVKIRSARYPEGRVCTYTVDFAYLDAEGRPIWEDYKGFDNAESRLRRAVVEAIYNIEIVVTGAAAKNTPRSLRGGERVG